MIAIPLALLTAMALALCQIWSASPEIVLTVGIIGFGGSFLAGLISGV